jgi:hypothetical protein
MPFVDTYVSGAFAGCIRNLLAMHEGDVLTADTIEVIANAIVEAVGLDFTIDMTDDETDPLGPRERTS